MIEDVGDVYRRQVTEHSINLRKDIVALVESRVAHLEIIPRVSVSINATSNSLVFCVLEAIYYAGTDLSEDEYEKIKNALGNAISAEISKTLEPFGADVTQFTP